MTNKRTLLAMAKEHFNDLSPAEEELFINVPTGESVNCGWTALPKLPKKKSRDKNKTIRSKCIEWICKNSKDLGLIHNHGIKIVGATIEGALDLECMVIPLRIGMFFCFFSKQIILRDTHINGLFITDSLIQEIDGERVHINSDFSLKNSKIKNRINISGCIINGDLNFRNAKIGENINESKKLKQCIIANSATIKGNLFLDEKFESYGEVIVSNINITGNISCSKGHFNNKYGRSLTLDTALINGEVFLDDGFTAIGTVRLPSAQIGGNLECLNGKFETPNGEAIFAETLTVKGFVALRSGFSAQGSINLSRSKINGSLAIHSANISKSTLYLEHASIGVLYDDEESWPEKGHLYIHGLVYDEIYHRAPRDAERRLRWLKLQPSDSITPQPFEHIATILRKAGHESDAREILIEKNRLAKLFNPNMSHWTCCWHFLFGLFVSYGYKPQKTLAWILLFLLLGASVFHRAEVAGMITQAQAWNIKQGQASTATMLGEPYPRFNALAYSLDTFVPFIDLDQEDYWIPANDNALHGTLEFGKLTHEPDGTSLFDIKSISFNSAFLHLYFWCHICLGWVFTGLVVIGITGMLQRRGE